MMTAQRSQCCERQIYDPRRTNAPARHVSEAENRDEDNEKDRSCSYD